MKSAKSPRILSASAASLLLRPNIGLRSLQRAGRWAGAAAVAALLGSSVQTATATDYFWTGAVDNLWNTPGNWTPPGPPGSFLFDDNLFFGAASNTNNVNNVIFPIFNSINFVPGAPSFVLGGGSIALDAGGITNNSTALQILEFVDAFGGAGINLTDVNGSRQVWNAASGDLLIKSDIVFTGIGMTLVITGAHNTTITGVISDGVTPATSTLVKQGDGILRLTAINTYPGDTVVNGGTLLVDGSIASNRTFVNPGGTLGGIGRIAGNVFNNGGNVAPGNSPGTLTVLRNYTQTSDGTLTIAVESKKSHSQLAVQGQADIDGTLRLVAIGKGARLKAGDRIKVLTAEGGVEGEFSEVDNSLFSNGTLLAGRVEYNDKSVEVVATTSSFEDFADDAGLSPNQRAVARGLDKIAFRTKTPAVIRYLSAREVVDLPNDFDRIAPEELSSIFNIGVSLATVQSQNLQRRTADIRAGSNGFSAAGFHTAGSGPSYSGTFGVAGPTGDGKESKKMFVPAEENRWGVFLTGVGEWVDVEGDGNARGFDINTGGFTIGLDYKVAPNLTIGVAAGYAGTGADLTNDGRVFVNSGKLGVYATYYEGGFYVDAAINGGLSGYDTRRGGVGGTARGSTEGGEVNILLGTGYDWQLGALTIGPTFNFQFTHLGIEEFTERGSLAPLNIPTQGQESYRTALGFKAAYDWRVGGVLVKPELRVAWQHEYGDSTFDVNAGFAGLANSGFTVRGPEIGRDSLLLGAGFAILWNERTSTYLYYDGDLARENYESHNVSGGVRLSF